MGRGRPPYWTHFPVEHAQTHRTIDDLREATEATITERQGHRRQVADGGGAPSAPVKKTRRMGGHYENPDNELRSTVGRITMALTFAMVISGISITPALADEHGRRQEEQDRGGHERDRHPVLVGNLGASSLLGLTVRSARGCGRRSRVQC